MKRARFQAIGKYVTERMKVLDINQAEAARRCRVTPQFFGRLQKGAVGIPKSQRKLYAKVLGTTENVIGTLMAEDYFHYYVS